MKYLIMTLVLISSAAFALTTLPSPVGYVNDFGHILSNPAALDSEIHSYENNTTIEIALVTLDSLPPDYTLFDYGVALFQQWGIGKKGEDNGILVLIVKNGTTGNRMRIELGYGIQGYVTGAEAGRILDDAMPYYQDGNYDTTVRVIFDGLYGQLKDYQPGARRNNDFSQPPIVFSIIFSSVAILLFAGSLFIFLKTVESNRSKKIIKFFMVLLPFLWIVSVLSVIAMIAVFGFGIIAMFPAIWSMRPKCPMCKSTKISYTYRIDSPIVNYECLICHKKWQERRAGRYRNGVFVAHGAGRGGGSFGGGFGGGASGGGGAGR